MLIVSARKRYHGRACGDWLVDGINPYSLEDGQNGDVMGRIQDAVLSGSFLASLT